MLRISLADGNSGTYLDCDQANLYADVSAAAQPAPKKRRVEDAKRVAKRTAMRRADRLFQIIQVLRRTRKPLTADAITA